MSFSGNSFMDYVDTIQYSHRETCKCSECDHEISELINKKLNSMCITCYENYTYKDIGE